MLRIEMPRPVPVLRGSLVTLRPIDPARDAEAYYHFSLDPELHVWTGNEVLPSVCGAEEELRRLAENPRISVWLIIDNATGELAGRFFLCLEDREGKRVVGEGNRIARRFWRKGHNRQARRLMFEYAFDVLGAEVYETETWEQNQNSVRSIESHGFHFVREEQRMNSKYGQFFKVRHYAMTADQWRQVRG